MRFCSALLPALTLGLVVFAGGCGQSTTNVKPDEVLDKEDYEAQLQEQAPLDGSMPKASPAGGKGQQEGTEGESN